MKKLTKRNVFLTVTLIFFSIISQIFAKTADFNFFDVTVTGKGTPIIFIHGYASEKAVWNETVDYLKSDFQCHVIQIAGFAGKAPFKSDNYLSNLKDEIAEYIKSNNLGKVIIVGHSMGGFLALWIASEYPNIVSKIVSVDGVPYLPAIYNTGATPESQIETAKKMYNYDNDFAQSKNKLTDEQLTQIFASMTIREDKIPILLNWSKSSDVRTLNQTMFEMMITDIREDVKKIEVPVLVFGAWIAYKGYGATKESAYKLYKLQFKNVSDCKIELTNKGKHFIMWDDFEWYSLTMKDFLNK